MVFSVAEANKIAKSALNLLKISVGYQLSKSVLDTLISIIQKNEKNIEIKKGGKKKYKMKGGAKSMEVKVIENAALKLLKVALVYDLSSSVLNEIKKMLAKNGYVNEKK